ncbi:tannase/feruloyl esterase family alpha/beta hydrolase [Microbacterium sp. dk485]|nr:tannase/feruloyl esterase family alpha/beta hydrolase [Microbacterium sp. dk485]
MAQTFLSHAPIGSFARRSGAPDRTCEDSTRSIMHRMTHAVATVTVALVAALLTSTAASAQEAAPPIDAERCAALVGMEIDAAEIGLPTTGAAVTAAEWVTETNGQCRVKGDIRPVDPTAPNITFQVNLPDNWNSRALQMGGGGLNGTLVAATGPYRYQPPGQPTPLQDGFVTLGSDGGHQGGGGSFALNAEALLNYGQHSIKKTHDVAMSLMKAAYSAEPEWFYFAGFSQGGHEALDAAGRYSDDYDGVVAGTPAYNVTMMHAGWGDVYKNALYADGGAGWVNPAKQTLLVDSVYATCDPIDGLADGIISDISGCLEAFDVQTLRCPDGADTGDTCLSDAQIATLDTLASPNDIGIDIAGNSVAAPNPIYNGGLLAGGTIAGSAIRGQYNLGLAPTPSNPAVPAQDAWHYQTGDTNAKWFVTGDPTLDYLDFDLRAHAERVSELGDIVDTTNVDFTPAHDKGVKILLYTGLADDGISPYNTIQFYDRQVAAMGKEKVDEFLKFYTIPGMSHGFGPFVAGFESLPALMKWVEEGVEPGTLTAIDTVAATAGRERPVCEYPTWPQYTGEDPDSADSFTCVTDASPVNTAAPLISGTPVVGSTLSASAGEWTGGEPTFAYQWLRDGQPIPGATSAQYRATPADQGTSLSVRVTATSAGGSTEATSASVTVKYKASVLVTTKPLLVTSTSKNVTVTVHILPSRASGDVTVTLAGRTFTGTAVDGRVTVDAGKLPRGAHVITATYAGDDAVAPGKGYGVVLVLR